MIYLDAAATTPVRREALEVMWPLLMEVFGNPSSHHTAGERAAAALADARRSVAWVLGCRTSEVIFTSGGSEGANLAIKGIALAEPRGRHIVTTRLEHEAVLESVDYLRRLHGFEVSLAEPDATGRVSGDALAAVLRPDTTMVSVHYANNEIGTVQPISELAARAHEVGARFHADAVQAAGWLSLDLRALGVDALSIAGHKLGAPKGCGVLAVRSGVALEPLIHGGGQERGRRSGTENVAGAAGLATALRLADGERHAAAAAQAHARDEFIAAVLESTPGARLTGDAIHRLPAHASFVFPGTGGEAVLLELERRGIIVSSGSACAAGSDEPSHVLTALGYTDDVAGTAVRFSWSAATPSEALRSVAAQVAEAVRAVAGIGSGTAADTR